MAEEKRKSGRPLGATGETVRRNIRWIRDARGISGSELSAELRRLDRDIPLLGIQRIEAGTRRVDVDDLAAIAIALGVSPASLLMPLRHDAAGPGTDAAVPSPGGVVQADDPVAIAGWPKPLSAQWVWGWLTAQNPLVWGALASFVELGWPDWEREQFDADLYMQLQRQKRERKRGDNDGDD